MYCFAILCAFDQIQTNMGCTMDNFLELEKLAELKDKGIINEEEFNYKKKELLGIKNSGEDSGEKQPELWNPSAVANWCLIFGPMFGAFLNAKNWRELGYADKAKISTLWAVLFPVCLIFSMQAKVGGSVIILIYLAAWYFVSAKPQILYVKYKINGDYEKKGWFKPISIALLLAFVFSVILLLLSEGSVD